ncbi:uncharacterized protein LOC119090702 [Pollicipes pollicipes]|uniref:uncharacterized protein LOC119089579 n=1 Tax=Pollicipes pollicipes TaxID=41117 RepID=UPI0018855A45|nr:uncharacterized protein LOC119089579 [Pollicipes pollicipes]XP_037069448.1 uncharacterized protein LOC119090702 [Pollicipes pollicipes]
MQWEGSPRTSASPAEAARKVEWEEPSGPSAPSETIRQVDEQWESVPRHSPPPEVVRQLEVRREGSPRRSPLPEESRDRSAAQRLPHQEMNGLRSEISSTAVADIAGATQRAPVIIRRVYHPSPGVTSSELVRRTMASTGGQKRVTTQVTTTGDRGKRGKEGAKRVITTTEVISGGAFRPTHEKHQIHSQKPKAHRGYVESSPTLIGAAVVASTMTARRVL